MHEEEILFGVRDRVATITLNRPQAQNAITWGMYRRLHDLCDELEASGDVAVVVVQGSGSAFASGTDIRQFREITSADQGVAYEAEVERVVGRLERLPLPTIASVRGYAAGAGLVLMSVCDLRVSDPSGRFGCPIARTVGNCLSVRNMARLASLIGPARVKELLFSARFLTAEEGLAVGLVNELVSADGLEARVEELCRVVAGNAPLTLRATKEGLRRLEERAIPDDRDLIELCYGSEGFREGVAAFLEHRAPKWSTPMGARQVGRTQEA
jgi:enoyl-CoA hydratase